MAARELCVVASKPWERRHPCLPDFRERPIEIQCDIPGSLAGKDACAPGGKRNEKRSGKTNRFFRHPIRTVLGRRRRVARSSRYSTWTCLSLNRFGGRQYAGN